MTERKRTAIDLLVEQISGTLRRAVIEIADAEKTVDNAYANDDSDSRDIGKLIFVGLALRELSQRMNMLQEQFNRETQSAATRLQKKDKSND